MAAAARDPYLWSALAALFLGLAAGQALRWALPARRAARSSARVAARRGRSARSLVFASLAILAAAALLVFPAKASLLGAGLGTWAIACLAVGALAGLWPRAAGLPLAALVAAAFLAVDLGLSGWLVFRGPGPVATLLPFEVSRPGPGPGPEAGGVGTGGAASFHGELETAERDSVPVVQELSMGTAEAALAVESIELRGPLGLAASLLRPGAEGRFYRLVALVGRGAAPFAFPPPARLLGRLAPIGDTDGLEFGAPPLERKALFGLFVRRRRTSASASLLALEPLRFGLDEDMEAVIEPIR